MPMQEAEYIKVRGSMKAGDVIAFGGKGDFSNIIKWATRSATSHVGIIIQTQLTTAPDGSKDFFNQIIESTTLNGFSGVAISMLSKRFEEYDGEVWWLPLSDAIRKKLDVKKFYEFLLRQDHKPYDMPQAVKSALDFLDNLPGRLTHNKEDFAKFFCSELAAAGLKTGGALPADLDSAEVTPIDLCMFDIYQDTYYQLKGASKEIRGFNTLDPKGWGA